MKETGTYALSLLNAKISELLARPPVLVALDEQLQECKSIAFQVKQELSDHLLKLLPDEKRHLINDYRMEIIYMHNEVSGHIRRLSKRKGWTWQFNGLQQQLTMLLSFIESKWEVYCSNNIRVCNTMLWEQRAALVNRYWQLQRAIRSLPDRLQEIICLPFRAFMQGGQPQYLTRRASLYLFELLAALEKLIAEAKAGKGIEEAVIMNVLIKHDMNSQQLLDYYQHEILAETERLNNADAAVLYIEVTICRIRYLLPGAVEKWDDTSDGISERLLPWLENLSALLEKEAAMALASQQKRSEKDVVHKFHYKDSGNVVAAFHKMLNECGIYEEEDLMGIMETVAATSTLPNTKNPSVPYLYGETRRENPKVKQALLNYVKAFKEYLMRA